MNLALLRCTPDPLLRCAATLPAAFLQPSLPQPTVQTELMIRAAEIRRTPPLLLQTLTRKPQPRRLPLAGERRCQRAVNS